MYQEQKFIKVNVLKHVLDSIGFSEVCFFQSVWDVDVLCHILNKNYQPLIYKIGNGNLVIP